MAPDEKLYLITRKNLKPGQQAVQAAHVMTQFLIEHAEIARAWHAQSNTLALLAAADENELQKIINRAFDYDIHTALFREPDLENSLTAIALEPGVKSQRLCKNLPLALET